MALRLLRKQGRGGSAEDPTAGLRIYYASDLHGSESCWRKFLAAPKFYKASVLILGGDLAGKVLVPIVEEDSGRRTATFMGERHELRDDAQVEELEQRIRFNGLYPYRTTAARVDELSGDPALAARVFEDVLVAELQRWCDLADERLSDEVQAFAICGNDDPWSLDEPLRNSRRLTFCDDQVVEVGGHELLSLSYANRTPWDSERELDEDELYRRIERLASQLERPEHAIFNLHVPPYDSGLDVAPQLDDELKPVMSGGAPVSIPVGSTAVRQAIEEFQPLLSLHGHIHECRGATTIGRTLAVNPGSDYASGRIDGWVGNVAEGEVHRHQLVSG